MLVSASGINYYGDRADAVVDEDDGPGDRVPRRPVVDWEGATAPPAIAGIRVVHLRNGIVLSGRGGALPKMARAVPARRSAGRSAAATSS